MDGAASGKVILCGEHAVVHGCPAIVASLERGVRARAMPVEGAGRLVIPDECMEARETDTNDLGRAFAALGQAARRTAEVTVWFDIPTRAGLGSSAAMAVAVARALGVPEDRVPECAQTAERVFHGQPSGIDVEAARRRGLGLFTRATGWLDLPTRPFSLCVGLSGRARSTRAAIGRVGALKESLPQAFDQIVVGIASVVEQAERAIARADLPRLGRLFDLNHGYLSALGVSAPELDLMCHLARSAGALGAKLTGAGGGGAVIALAPGGEDRVLTAWSAAGFRGFVTRVPCTQ
jgi:mevalonate kinase